MEKQSSSREQTLQVNENDVTSDSRNLNSRSLQQAPNEQEKHLNSTSLEQEIQAPNEQNAPQEKCILPVCDSSNNLPCNSTTIKTAVPGVIMINFAIEDIGETAVITISNVNNTNETNEQETKDEVGLKSKEVQLKKQNQNNMENPHTENSEDLVSDDKDLEKNNEKPPFSETLHKGSAAVRFKIDRDAESNLLVQDIKIEKSQGASFNEEPISHHQSDVTHKEKAENSMKKAVVKIKKLTKKEIDAYLYAGKYHVKAKKKHKKHKKDRKKHKSLKFNSGNILKDEKETVNETRKTTLTNETANSKKRALSSDKSENQLISKEKNGVITTSSKKVKMEPSIAKQSTPLKRKKQNKDNQHVTFHEEELFYPPDRMVRISSHNKDKKIKSDGKSSISEVKNPSSLEDKSPTKDANLKQDTDTTPSTSQSCGKQVATNQNKNGKTKEVNQQALKSSSAQKKVVTKIAIADTENKERRHYDAEINERKIPLLVSEESEGSTDDSSSLFSTDSSLPMNILELLFESSSDTSPSEFEGF